MSPIPVPPPIPTPDAPKRAPAVWPIDPLPDFLTDHTLTGKEAPERIREYAARWVQLAGSLWEWNDRATFALRYYAQDGRIGVYFLAVAHQPAEAARLESEISVILRAHRLAEPSAGKRVEWDEFCRQTRLEGIVLSQIRQLSTRELWSIPANRKGSEQVMAKWPDVKPEDWKTPPVIYPWWGPGGPFLLPMESLISQPVPASLTIYLQPTRLKVQEREWLALMAREAQTAAEQSLQEAFVAGSSRVADPLARLAGRLYMANLRRLSASPFLVTVHCAAAGQRTDVVLSLAGAVQSLVHEPAFERPQQEDDRLPSGARVVMPAADQGGRKFQEYAAAQYEKLVFEEVPGRGALGRLPDLADAQGAATVFRLPVSVRGGVPGVRVRQLSPLFHPGARQDTRPDDCIRLGSYHSGGGAFVPVRDLTKHTLITGFTGSGKTLTVLQILHQLWADHHKPFLVIESAKQEYRGLIGVPKVGRDLRVYTLGNETCVPFRLNPFELLPGTRVEAHVSKLQTCFEGAIPPIGPSSSIIAEALLRVYERCGWQLTDYCPEKHVRRFPQLSHFIEEVRQVLEARNYVGEVASNLEAALIGRFKPLTIGSKGMMFSSQRSSPSPRELFTSPVVLELNDLNLDDKALVTMFVLMLLREYRELERSATGDLLHVTLVEEAHNILEDVGSNANNEGSSSDTRYKTVQAFCQLLTEIRSLGEGLIIADQSPMKLARDAMRNTNLQVAHQLRDGQDRNAVANAMIMEVEQRDFLGKLPPGDAAMFRTGLEKATFIKVDQYYPSDRDLKGAPTEGTAERKAWNERFAGYGFRTKVGEPEVREHMRRMDSTLESNKAGEFPFPDLGCLQCACPCKLHDAVGSRLDAQRFGDRHWTWESIVAGQREGDDLVVTALLPEAMRAATQLAGDCTPPTDGEERDGLGWCSMVHVLAVGLRPAGGRVVLEPSVKESFAAMVANPDQWRAAIPTPETSDDPMTETSADPAPNQPAVAAAGAQQGPVPYPQTGCQYCKAVCEHRQTASNAMVSPDVSNDVDSWASMLRHEDAKGPDDPDGPNDAVLIGGGWEATQSALAAAGHPDPREAPAELVWCCHVHVLHRALRVCGREWPFVRDGDREAFESSMQIRLAGRMGWPTE